MSYYKDVEPPAPSVNKTSALVIAAIAVGIMGFFFVSFRTGLYEKRQEEILIATTVKTLKSDIEQNIASADNANKALEEVIVQIKGDSRGPGLIESLPAPARDKFLSSVFEVSRRLDRVRNDVQATKKVIDVFESAAYERHAEGSWGIMGTAHAQGMTNKPAPGADAPRRMFGLDLSDNVILGLVLWGCCLITGILVFLCFVITSDRFTEPRKKRAEDMIKMVFSFIIGTVFGSSVKP